MVYECIPIVYECEPSVNLWWYSNVHQQYTNEGLHVCVSTGGGSCGPAGAAFLRRQGERRRCRQVCNSIRIAAIRYPESYITKPAAVYEKHATVYNRNTTVYDNCATVCEYVCMVAGGGRSGPAAARLLSTEQLTRVIYHQRCNSIRKVCYSIRKLCATVYENYAAVFG